MESVGPARVLVVDDEPAVRGVLVEILGDAGFEVVGEAADGLEALERARSVEHDVVLLDIKMPGLDGIEAAARLHAERDATRIVMFSAYDDEALRQRASAAGAAAFVVKGCPFSDVVAAIRGEAGAFDA